MDIAKNKDSLDPLADVPNGSNPRHQFYARSSIDLPKKLETDLTIRYVDSLPGINIPSYYSFDAHVGWKPHKTVEFSIGGQNLTNNRHLEFIPDFISTSPSEVKRTFYSSMTLRF
jgi:iron complex outermembrane receptor protein